MLKLQLMFAVKKTGSLKSAAPPTLFDAVDKVHIEELVGVAETDAQLGCVVNLNDPVYAVV